MKRSLVNLLCTGYKCLLPSFKCGHDSWPLSAHTLLTENVPHSVAAGSVLVCEAHNWNRCSAFSLVPNTFILPSALNTLVSSLSIALYHFLNLLTRRAAVSPARDSISSLLFTFQTLTSEIVFCITLRGFVLWDSSDSRHKELCDQKRKKGLCCHFQFCITHLAVIVVARDVCSVWRLTLLWCCWEVFFLLFLIATVTAWPLARIKLLQFRCFLKDSCSVIRTQIERNIFSAYLLMINDLYMNLKENLLFQVIYIFCLMNNGHYIRVLSWWSFYEIYLIIFDSEIYNFFLHFW